MMAPFQNTFKNHTKHNFKQKQVIYQVTKSPWKTIDKKGANTFPFHNLPSELKKQSQRSFLCFFTFPFWIKEKSMATLANRNICNQTQNTQVSSPTVSQCASTIHHNISKFLATSLLIFLLVISVRWISSR